MDKYDINMKELEILEKNGAFLIDVRSPQEYMEGHLSNAVLIPEYELSEKIQYKIKRKEDIIIVYCSTGIRSKKAQKRLKEMGYNNVFNLYKGIENNI